MSNFFIVIIDFHNEFITNLLKVNISDIIHRQNTIICKVVTY